MPYRKPFALLSFFATVILLLAACSLRSPPFTITAMNDTAKPYHHASNGRFRNPPGSPKRENYVGDLLKMIFTEMPFLGKPEVPVDHVATSEEMSAQLDTAGNPSVTWLGHAAFIVRTGGKVILTDPFLSKVAGPYGFGPSRFVDAAIPAGKLPRADVMIISHNHYDHLDSRALHDYPYKDSIQVIVPLGVGKLFKKLGYQHIVEHDWWDEWSADGLKITTLPAVHFSGRGLFDRNKTLWASFSIDSGSEKVWFGGDTGIGEVFREIGERAGPFDLALVPIGAYTPRSVMKAVHVNPEEAVEIVRMIGAEIAIGMHWGTIQLTPEEPFEAPDRFRQAAIDQGLGEDAAWILKIGESRSFNSDAFDPEQENEQAAEASNIKHAASG